MRHLLDAVAAALVYPDRNARERAGDAARLLREAHPETPHELLAQALDALGAYLAKARRGEPEERYAAIFDLTPAATLNLGYHVWGDAYERGTLLAGLGRELRRLGIDRGAELADALPILLQLLGRLESTEDRELLVEHLLRPGLARLLEALGESQDPWSAVLRALGPLVDVLHPPRPVPVEAGAGLPGEVTAHA